MQIATSLNLAEPKLCNLTNCLDRKDTVSRSSILLPVPINIVVAESAIHTQQHIDTNLSTKVIIHIKSVSRLRVLLLGFMFTGEALEFVL